jgi:beta-lactamase superfamily II metal-dependent hydrolase
VKLRIVISFVLCLALEALLHAQSRTLDIYWIDVEGGAAPLIVTPSGQSLLVDTGNGTPDDRDAKRIYEAAQQAGLKRIDYVLTTHFHGDHVGGLAALSKMISIDRFFDHGDSIETGSRGGAQIWETYTSVTSGKRTTMKSGDKLPLQGVDATIVSSNGQTLTSPINGGGPNALCQGAQQKPADTTENQRSLGFLLTFGKFKFLDVGDLTWDKEMELACPLNKLGTVTLMQATHHGFFNDFSGAPAHVLVLKPQIVLVNNGPRKGWQPSAWDLVSKIDGLEGIWQGHQALGSDSAHNTKPEMIANLEPTSECQGHWIKASVQADGRFTITNGRTGFSKTYTAR